MKSAGERSWMKMSMHGKKEFLGHHEHDKKLASASWQQLPDEVKKQFSANPIAPKQEEVAA